MRARIGATLVAVVVSAASFYARPRPLVDVALEQGETVDRQIVHRISPEDPWRRVRNRWRAAGVVADPPPQPPSYLIGSSGVTLYRGTAFPADYRQDILIGIAGKNLVHHRRLVPDGGGFRARRLPDESAEEFLASTDLWFRPVAFAKPTRRRHHGSGSLSTPALTREQSAT